MKTDDVRDWQKERRHTSEAEDAKIATGVAAADAKFPRGSGGLRDLSRDEHLLLEYEWEMQQYAVDGEEDSVAEDERRIEFDYYEGLDRPSGNEPDRF